MLATETTNSEPTSGQSIGTIEFLMGAAVAVAADGRERVVVVGDALYEGEVLKAVGQSTVEIRLSDKSLQRVSGDGIPAAKFLLAQNDTDAAPLTDPSLAELPASEEPGFSELLEQSPPEAGQPTTDAEPSSAAFSKLLEEEPPGAGGERSDGYGFVVIPLDLPQPIPEAGFETEGLAYEFPEGIEGGGLTNELTIALLTIDEPSLNVTMEASVPGGTADAGEVISYTIAVANTGNQTLTGVTVSDPFVSNLTRVADTSGDNDNLLELGETWAYTASHIVTQADVDAGRTIDNTATADSDQSPEDSDSTSVPVGQPSLRITKSNDGPTPNGTGGWTDLDGSGDVSAGDTITYSYTVTNTGTADFTNVTLADDKLATVDVTTLTSGLSDIDSDGTADDLAAGGSAAGTASYVIQASDLTAGSIVNLATADTDQTDPVTDTSTVQVPSSALRITKSNDGPTPNGTGGWTDLDGSGDVSAGDTITYSYTVTNTGTADFTNVTLADDKLATVDVTTLTSGLSDIDSDGTADDLAAGGSAAGTASYVIQASDLTAGSIVNLATADTDQTDPVTDTSTVQVPSSALRITKSNDGPTPNGTGGWTDLDGSGDVSAGDTITYSYTVTNTGTADFTNVTLADDKLATVDVTTLTSGLSDIDSDGTADDLAAGGSAAGTASYVIQASDLTAGSIVNLATADTDQTDPVTDTSTVQVPSSALRITKSNDGPTPNGTGGWTDLDGSGDVSAGDTITYSYTVTNTGTADFTNVTLADDKLATVDVTTLTSGLSDIDSDGTADDLAAGGSAAGTASYVIQASDLTAGSIVNLATADTDQTDPVTDTSTVQVPSSALRITKSNDGPTPNGTGGWTDLDGSGDVSAGDTITYSYTVTNTGTADFTNVTLADDKLATVDVTTLTSGLSDIDSDGTADDLAAGGSAAGTASYVIQASDLTAGSIVNLATADTDQTDPVTDTSTVQVPSSALRITKSNDGPTPNGTGGWTDLDGSGDVSAGDTITYSYTVTNTGTADFTNVTLADDKLATVDVTTLTSGLSDIDSDGTADDLAAGGSAAGTASYVIQASDLTAGSIVNLATADTDQTDPVTDTSTVQVPSSALRITKSNDGPTPNGTGGWTDLDGSGDVSAGDTITYSYTLTNAGTANFTNVTLADNQLPSVNALATLTSGLTDIDSDGVADDLAAGASATGTASYVIQASDLGGDIVNIATADTDQTDPVTDPSTVTVPPPPTLSISDAMVREGTPLAPGADIQFTVTRGGGDLNTTTTVNFTVVAGTAVEVKDYTGAPGALGGTLTFLPNETMKSITLDVVDDLVPEPNQQFTVELSNPSNATLVNGVGTGTIKELVIDLDGDNSSLAPATHTFGADPVGIVANFESSYEINEQALPFPPGQIVRIADDDTAITLADGSPIMKATITLPNAVPGDTFTFTDPLNNIKGSLSSSGDTLTLTLEPVAQSPTVPDWVDALKSVNFNPTTDASTDPLDRLEARFVSVQVDDATGSSNVAIAAVTPSFPQVPPSTVSVFTVGDLNPATPDDIIRSFDQKSGFIPDRGDVLELSDLISGPTPAPANIDQFVRITTDGVDSIVSVDSDGGANSFVDVAVLAGITSGQVDVLVGDHDTLLQVNVL